MRRTTMVTVVVVGLLCLLALSIHRKKTADATYRVRLTEQPVPPCGIATMVPNYLDDRRPATVAFETPLLPTQRVKASDWNDQDGDLVITSDGGGSPVKTAMFTTDDGRSLALSSHAHPPLVHSYC